MILHRDKKGSMRPNSTVLIFLVNRRDCGSIEYSSTVRCRRVMARLRYWLVLLIRSRIRYVKEGIRSKFPT